MAQVAVHGVSKSYGKVRAVDEVDLEIADGEFAVLVGPSGCGKTTLLRLMAGLEEVTEGSIVIGGETVTHLPAARRDIGMVFQSYALYPHMKVFDNMAYNLKVKRVPKREIRERVDESARTFGLDELLDRRPAALSGGQRQRVALARALIRRPQLFLLDEPLSNLDAQLRGEMRVELKRLHREFRVTTLFVTHDQIEAMTLGTTIIVMKDGKIQQVGKPLDLYQGPINLFVAGFLGSPPMNLLPGSVASDRRTITMEIGVIESPRPIDGAREVVMGMRPENLDVVEKGAGAFAGTIDVVEHLGGSVISHIDCSGQSVRVAGRDHGYAAGSEIGVDPQVAHVHVFDRESGANLRRVAGEPAAAEAQAGRA